MKLGDRIKALRIKNILTQKELGDKIGVSTVSIGNWESGIKNPTTSAVVAMAGVFGVTTDYLLGVRGNGKNDELLLSNREAKLISCYRVLDGYGKKAVEVVCSVEKSRVEHKNSQLSKTSATKSPTRYIPLYDTPSAAGYSVPLDGDDFEMILADESVPDDADFAVRIQGDSMFPYIHDGETVYIKKDCALSIGDVGIFCVDGAMYCKQYYVDDEGNLSLLSANPLLRHTNVYVRAEYGASVICYGKVLLDCEIELPSYMFE